MYTDDDYDSELYEALEEYFEYVEEEIRREKREKRLANWEKCYQVAEVPKILPNGRVVGIVPFEFEEYRGVDETEDKRQKNGKCVVDEKEQKYKRCCAIL